MDEIPVCIAYEIDGIKTFDFPTGDRLNRAKPVIEYFAGFGDVSGCRSFDELPDAAKKYIRFIEESTGCPIKYISVGAGRDEYIAID